MLILIRQAPQTSPLPAAALDILLTAAAFDRQPVLAFSGNGVLHLLREQAREISGMKSISQALPALELYGVSEILAESEALHARGLQAGDLLLPVIPVSRDALASRLADDAEVFVC